ncbi:hypothetical protein [Propionivibrio limicola]|uniref:hypothetical protein n=1 Tax=Propionivibrio limicola TaxID=167645 RepID=UPI00129129C1|nr:hypothetical protein [Propionivibrio limicola]
MPDWSGDLRNLYWFLRYRRSWDSAGVRRYYRKIGKEKRRLLDEVGVDQEELRLLCRFLANPRNRRAEERWLAYRKLLLSNS